MKVLDLPEVDRPRERLLSRGQRPYLTVSCWHSSSAPGCPAATRSSWPLS